MVRIQCVQQSRLLNQPSARGVDKRRAGLHFRKKCGVTHAVRFVAQRTVEAHIVRSGQQFILSDQLDAVLFDEFLVRVQFAGNDFHAHCHTANSRAATDPSQTDQAERLLANRLGQLVRPSPLTHVAVVKRQPLRAGEDQRESQFGNRLVI